MKRGAVTACMVVIAVVLWAQPPGFVKPGNGQLFVDGYHAMCKSTTSFQAHFEQVKQVALLKNDLRSEGQMYMRRDHKIKIAYTSPYRYVFVMNGETISIKDNEAAPTTMDMRNSKLFKQISAVTLAGINGQLLATKEFATTVYESPGYYLVQAVPQAKEMKAYYKLFELYFDKHTFQAAKIVMTEVSGDVSTLTFSDIEINKAIDDAVFVVH